MSGSQKCSFCSRSLEEIQELYPSQDGKAFICFDCSRVAFDDLKKKLPADLTRPPILRARNLPSGRPWVAPDLSRKLGDVPVHGAYLARRIDLGALEISDDLMRWLPREVCERNTLIPVEKIGNLIIVAVVGTDNIAASDDLKFLTGCHVNFIVSDEKSIRAAIKRCYPEGG